MVYTVGDAAKMLNVAPSTLRYYDKEGLLPFVERSEGGIRMFKDSDLDWLKLIECLKRTGMPIKGIRQFIECTARGDGTIGERLDILERQRDSVKSRLPSLKSTLKCWTIRFGITRRHRKRARRRQWKTTRKTKCLKT